MARHIIVDAPRRKLPLHIQ